MDKELIDIFDRLCEPKKTMPLKKDKNGKLLAFLLGMLVTAVSVGGVMLLILIFTLLIQSPPVFGWLVSFLVASGLVANIIYKHW